MHWLLLLQGMKILTRIINQNNKLFSLSILLVLVVKSIYLFFFCYIYTDSDQTMQWLAATEYASGTFNSLFFYGQDYNPMIEALLAAPLVYVGVPPYIALPTITTLMGLTPWIFAIYILYKNSNLYVASVLLLILAALPYDYHIVNTISRGWVHGLFIASIGLFILFNTNNNKTVSNVIKVIIAGILGGAGTYICPNVILFFIPMAIYWWILKIEYKLTPAIILGFCFVLGVFITFKMCLNFPFHSYIKHWNTPIELGFKYFLNNVKYVYLLFNGFVPIHAYLGVFIILILFLFTWQLYKKRAFQLFWPCLTLTVLVLFTLFTLKSNNGQGNPFFPYIRFYLAIPIILYTFLLLHYQNWVQLHRQKIVYTLFVLVFIHLATYPINQNKYIKTDEFVRVVPIKQICKACDSIDVVMKNRKQDKALIFKKCDEIAFGCPALGYKYHFLYPEYERHKLNNELFSQSDTSQLLHIYYENKEYMIKE